MEFKLWLELASQYNMFIDPDTLYFSDSFLKKSFIYTSSGEMYYGHGMHSDIIRANGLNKTIYNDKKFKDPHSGVVMRSIIADYDLVGRISDVPPDHKFYIADNFGIKDIENTKIVSFWGRNKSVFDRLLLPCLKLLHKDQVIDMNHDIFSSVIHKTMPISHVTGSVTKELSPEEIEHYELRQKLHLMRPEQKKQAMTKLGLASGGKINPYLANKTIIPGQKHWALNSENVF